MKNRKHTDFKAIVTNGFLKQLCSVSRHGVKRLTITLSPSHVSVSHTHTTVTNVCKCLSLYSITK